MILWNGGQAMNKKLKSNTLFDYINIIMMILVLLVVLIPIFNVLGSSVTGVKEAVSRRIFIFPKMFDFGAYRFIFTQTDRIIQGYVITIFRAVVGTVLSLVLMYFLSYGLSKNSLPGRKSITFFIFFAMLFSGGLIPSYILIRSLGLINNIWVYVIPGLITPWYVLLLRNFIMQLPESLTEAAIIDGASELQVVLKIIMPLSLPALATVGLFIIVGHWNAWFDAMLFVRETDKQPLQMILRNTLISAQILVDPSKANFDILKQDTNTRAVQSATIVVATVPIVMVYPFLQKYFVKGIMVGSIKG
jgi:putative aldouronate transport system permease protein